MTAALAWLSAPLWGTVSRVEAGWLVLIAGILLYLKGHLCDALAQRRAAQDPVERRAAQADVWAEVRELFEQACFGLIGLYAALTPPATVDPERVLGTLAVTALLIAIQLATLVFAHYRRESRRWITAELRRQQAGGRRGPVDPTYAGPLRRSTDPPSHERRPLR